MVVKFLEIDGNQYSVIGLGASKFGSKMWNDQFGLSPDSLGHILGTAIELGINVFDTIRIYGSSRQERLVGTILSGEARPVTVISKFAPLSLSADHVLKYCEGSLSRLGASRIDLYCVQPHKEISSTQHLGESLTRLLESGYVSNVGVSNYSSRRWEELEASMKRPVVSNRVRYSLLSREIEQEVLPYAVARNRIIFAHSPLEHGVLSGNYPRLRRPGDLRRLSRHYSPDALERMQPLLMSLEKISNAHSATFAQIALAWIISHPNVVVVPRVSSVDQVRANAEASEIELSADEVEELNDSSELYRQATGFRITRSIRTRLGI